MVKIPLGEGGTSHYCLIKGGKDWSQLLLAQVELGRIDLGVRRISPNCLLLGALRIVRNLLGLGDFGQN